MRRTRWLSSSPLTCYTAVRFCATTTEFRSGASAGVGPGMTPGPPISFKGDERMDIRMYFQKIRETERNIQDPYVVVVSLETPEGGKPGRTTEVSRASAAQLIVEGKVRLADDAE